MSKPASVATTAGITTIVLLSLAILLWAQYRYGRLVNIMHFEVRKHRLSQVCREIRVELEKRARFEFVSVHIAKEPSDIIVEGFVPTSGQLNDINDVVSRFRTKVSIDLNVRVDTNAIPSHSG